MITIKARTKNGVITYKDRYTMVAKIEQYHSGKHKGKFAVFCDFTETNCGMCIMDTLEDSKRQVEKALKESYSFLVGEDIKFIYLEPVLNNELITS